MKIVIQLIRMSTRQMGQRYYQCHQLGQHIDKIVMTMMMVVMIEEEDYRTKWWMLLGHRVTNEVGKRIILSTGSGSDYQIPSRTIATFSLPSYISYIIVIIILIYHQC